MKIAMRMERRAGEARVAAWPDMMRKLIALGLKVIIGKGAFGTFRIGVESAVILSRRLRGLGLAVAVFLVCLWADASAAGAKKEGIRLTLAHSASARSTEHTLYLKPWAQRLNILSAGRLSIVIEPQDQATVRATDLFDRLNSGAVEMIWVPATQLPDRFPLIGVFELPFMAWPAEVISQAAMEFYRRHRDKVASDLHVILLHADAPGWLHMRDRPMRHLADLKGRRLYVPTASMVETVRALGAEPVTLAHANEAGLLLARGELDGALMSFKTAAPAGVVGATRHHIQTGRPPGLSSGRPPGLFTVIYALLMNKARYAALPGDLKKVIAKSAGRVLAERTGRSWDSVDRLYHRDARSERMFRR